MLTFHEIASVVVGLRRLLRFDILGFACFDTTAEGVRRSFRAAWVVAPIYAIDSLLMFLSAPTAVTFPQFAIMRVLTYIILWTLWPVTVFDLSRWLGCQEHFAKYIVAYNWFRVIESTAMVPLIILQQSPFGHNPMVESLLLTMMVAMIVYNWFIIRVGLRVGATTAFALVVIDLLLSDLVHVLGNALG